MTTENETMCRAHDERLIEAACRGDREAFGELVQKYQDRLFNGMVRKAWSTADAEDVVQEAFVQAYLKLDTFRHESSFFTWLYRIALNLAWTRRHRTRRETPFADLSELPGTERQMPESPCDRLTRKEDCDLVHGALAHLRDDQRTILELREMQGFDYATIAEITNTKIGTVRSRIHRAREALRQQLLIRERAVGLSS